MLRLFILALTLPLLFPLPAFSEEVNFNTQQTFTLGEEQIPTNITLRLEDSEPTRLRTTVFVDLQNFQTRLPEMIDGPIYDDCDFGVSLNLQSLEPTDAGAGIVGQVTLRLNSCKEEDGNSIRSSRLSAKVDFSADVFADVANNCLTAGLEDLALDGRGLIGSLADLIGIVDKAREVILEKAATVTSENPICPDLPEALDVLAPSFDAGGITEFPTGSLGASMSGTVEVTATSLVGLFALLEERGALTDLGQKTDCACDEPE